MPDDLTGKRLELPFTAIVNHEELKLALLLNAINPKIGGLLITGPKGTGKTTIVRSLAALLPEIPVVSACQFRCAPDDAAGVCVACKARLDKNEPLKTELQKMRVINLPLSATEDRVVGSLDVEQAIREGVAALKPGILASANQNILYVDEVNLLPDHIVDALLDAAASGVNVVEREGISVSHPARFIFIGSMNPEEGELRPQLLDRFPLHVAIQRPFSDEERVEIIRLNLAFDRDPRGTLSQWAKQEEKLRRDIDAARKRMKEVVIPDSVMQVIAYLTSHLQVDGARPDIVIAKTAMAFAAFDGRIEVTVDDVEAVAPLALSHRTRQRGILEPPSRQEVGDVMKEARKKAKTENPQAKDKDPHTKEDHQKLTSKFRKFHALDSNQDGERFTGTPPKKKAGGRLSYTGFVCFFGVMAAAIGLLIPILFPVNFLIGGLLAAGMVLLLERILRSHRRPGIVMPSLSEGDSPPAPGGKFRRAKHRGEAGGSPAASATAPKSVNITRQEEPQSRKPFYSPSLVRLDQGKPLFHLEEILQPRYFGRQRAPKWSIRQVGRRAGSGQSRKVENGVLLGASLPQGSPRSIHLPATISAAALHTGTSTQSPRVRIQPPDVREKRFRSWTPLTIIFVIDLSISMVKNFDKLQLSLLAFKNCLEGTRDRVGLIALKDWGAIEVQAPTTNWTRLVAKLMTLRLSGYTPLAAGLRRAHETIKRERRRNPGTLPLVVVFSDFLPNIQLQGSDTPDIGLPEAIADVLHQCHLLRKDRIPLVTINLHHEFFRIKNKRHHDVIFEWVRQRSQELNLANFIEVGIQEDKLIPFLAFYMAYITSGRTYLGDELATPTVIIREIHRVAQGRN